MATVVLTGPLKDLAGGQEQINVEAANVHQLLRILGERYPALKPRLEKGLAVAIDGEVYQNAWLQPIPEDSEVHLLAPLAGG
ncbi:MAG: MoaD/ThiS family protein [Alphaproteobacteria bacterium]